MKKTTRQDAIEKAKIAISQYPSKKWGLEIAEDKVYQESGWWYVPVIANSVKRDISYYDLIANINGELQDVMGLNIMVDSYIPV